jgi:hypothetical protein
VLGAAALGGCATMNVSSHVESGVDFAAYRTFDWGPADSLPTGDPRLDKDPFFKDQIQGAVEKGLAARGMTIATSGTPDLLIHYHAAVTERIDVVGADRRYGYCQTDDCRGQVVAHEAGTLVIDVVDTRTQRVIWRGWAQDRLEPLLDNRDTLATHISEAVARMLARFPTAVSR